MIDSLQLTAKHKVATPVNWKQGEDVIIAGSVSDDEAQGDLRRAGRRRSPTSGSSRSQRSYVILEQYYLGCLAHASYLIADQRVATRPSSTPSATSSSTWTTPTGSAAGSATCS